MHDDDDIPWDAAGQLEVLTFDLHGESFALEAGIVQEILDLLPETPVPGSPRMVAGVVNFRGKVIPLADLRIAFGMPPAAPTIDSRIVVIAFDLDGEASLVGLKADKVHEVAALSKAASEAPPQDRHAVAAGLHPAAGQTRGGSVRPAQPRANFRRGPGPRRPGCCARAPSIRESLEEPGLCASPSS